MSNQEFTYLQPHTHQAFKRIVRFRTSYVQKRTNMFPTTPKINQSISELFINFAPIF